MRFVLLFLSLALYLHAEVRNATAASAPNRIRSSVLVLSPQWPAQIPPKGPVNVPEFFTTVYPGQRIAVGLVAEGPDREHAFDGAKVSVQIAPEADAPIGRRDLPPITVRHLKAEGADFALMALEAGGISTADRTATAEKTTLVTLAVFVPDWTVPATSAAAEVTLTVDITGTMLPVTLEAVHLKIRPTSDWLAGPAPSAEEAGKQLNRHRSGVAPGELISWLGAVARAGHLRIPAASSYFVFAFKTNPAAHAAAIAVCEQADPELQPALLLVLRRGGDDLSQLFPTLPAAALEPFEAVEPLADPRQLPQFRDPVDPSTLSKLGNTMDECWSGWSTTGDKTYLRAIVNLLEGASDYPALTAWQKARSGAKGLNARVARGLAYQIAGWSISSFQRADPQVMDWLLFWQNDPTVSPIVRREIAALPTNPAFRRK